MGANCEDNEKEVGYSDGSFSCEKESTRIGSYFDSCERGTHVQNGTCVNDGPGNRTQIDYINPTINSYNNQLKNKSSFFSNLDNTSKRIINNNPALNKWLNNSTLKVNGVLPSNINITKKIVRVSSDRGAGLQIAQIFGAFTPFNVPVFSIKNSGKEIGGYRSPGVAFVCSIGQEENKYTEANELLHAFIHKKHPVFAKNKNPNFLTINLLNSIGATYTEPNAGFSLHQLNEYFSDVVAGLVAPKGLKYYGGGAVGNPGYSLSSSMGLCIRESLKMAINNPQSYYKQGAFTDIIYETAQYLKKNENSLRKDKRKNLSAYLTVEQYYEIHKVLSIEILQKLGIKN